MSRGSTRFAIVLAAGITLTLGILMAANHTNTDSMQYGTLNGRVLIGPWCGAEKLGNPCTGPNDTYSSRSLILLGDSGRIMYVDLNADGTFNSTVPAGRYSISVTNCTFLGCSRLNESVTIYPQARANLTIDIDTGIR